MGQAKITGGGPTGLYNVEIVKHPGKSAARLTAIAARLTALGDPHGSPVIPGLIPAALLEIDAAVTALSDAQADLERSISDMNNSIPSLAAVPRWYNSGNGTCIKVTPGPTCAAGQYLLVFGTTIPGNYSTSPVIPDAMGWTVEGPNGFLPSTRTGSYSSSEINFTVAEGSVPFASGDAFDIEVTEAARVPVTPVSRATAKVLMAQADLLKKRRNLSFLNAEKASITEERALIDRAMAVESKAGIWCTDLTENLAVNAIVGTMEMNGVDDEIILTPGGKLDKSIGLLQHVGVSTPAAVFVNKARLPAWQKWKPTHRVGTITSIDYSANTCSVGISEQYSEEQGLKINQAGAVYAATKAAVAGWTDFATRNPAFGLVANTANANLTSTPQLLVDLERINGEVNDRYTYKTDQQQYGKLENWQLMEPGGSGDCEDFALTKAKKLLDMGYAASAIHIEVGTSPNGQGHAWLVVQTDKGEIALDNNYKTTMNNNMTPYTNRRRQTGMNWTAPGVLLSGAPIEYMDGTNAGAFLVGDRVVVQFIDQDWKRPKVVGFETNPRAGFAIYAKYLITPPYISYGTRRYSTGGTLAGSVNLAQDQQSVMGSSADRKTVAVATFPGSGMTLSVDLYTAGAKRSISVDLWTGNVSAYFGQWYTKADCNITDLGCVFYDSGGILHVSVVIIAGSVIRRYIKGFIAINTATGAVVGSYAHDYGLFGVIGDPPAMPGACIAGGKIYLADVGEGVSYRAVLRILNESTYAQLSAITLSSAIAYSGLAVWVTDTKVYCAYSDTGAVMMKVFDGSTLALLRTVTIASGSIGWGGVGMFIAQGKLIVFVCVSVTGGYETTMFTFSLEGIQESSLSLGSGIQTDFTLAASNVAQVS